MTDPTAVPIDAVRAALNHLGIAWDDVTEIRMDTRCITVVRYARAVGGRIPIYGGKPVTRTTAIAIEWDVVEPTEPTEPSDTTAIGVTPRSEQDERDVGWIETETVHGSRPPWRKP